MEMGVAQILSTVSLISFIVSGISLVAAIIIFVYFKIPSVIGDLSGRTARKSISMMRLNNERTGNKSFKTSPINAARGKITENIPDLRNEKGNSFKHSEMPETGLIAENKPESSEEQTALLEDKNDTTLLYETNNDIRKNRSGVKLNLIEEVMLIHTDEVIG